MKKYLFLLYILFTSVYANTSDFSIIINKPFSDALFDVTQDYDRDISAVGFSKNYKKTHQVSTSYTDPFEYLQSLRESYGTHMHLVKVDNNANIRKNISLKISNLSKALSVIKTPSNGYFIGGYTLDGSIVLIKLTSDIHIIFKKIFGTKNFDKLKKLVKLSDGGVLVVGSSNTNRITKGNIFETGLGLNDIYLVRFDKYGNKLWSKKYGTSYDDEGIDAVEADDNSIIVLSKTSYNANQDITLMRITENGDKIWLKHYKNKNISIPYKIIKLKDRNFLISSSQKDETKKEKIRLIKFDIQTNILIDKIIDTTYSSALKDIKEFLDGTLMGVGYVKDGFNTDALVMILSSSLNFLKQEHYGNKNYEELNALTILHNSQAVGVGMYTYENSQETNMWIVKLNKDATIAKKQTSSLDMYKELIKIFKDDIASKKIKIFKDLSIIFTAKELYFKVGKYKLTKEQKNYLLKFSNKLIKFLEKYKNIVTVLEINGHTSSEWGNTNFTNRYLKNEKLSMNRSYSTLRYIFKKQNISKKKWLIKILKGSGLSFSKSITDETSKNRRVSFKIITK